MHYVYSFLLNLYIALIMNLIIWTYSYILSDSFYGPKADPAQTDNGRSDLDIEPGYHLVYWPFSSSG